jgi:hypothetical protein
MGGENVIVSILLQLGYAETYSLGLCGQDQSDLSDLPVEDDGTLYQLLTEPNNVNLEKLTVDMPVVSFEIRFTLKCCCFRGFTGMWCCVVCSVL